MTRAKIISYSIAAVVIVALVAVLVINFINSPKQAAKHQADQYAQAVDNQETAYENVVKDSLKTFRARYETYPATYDALLADMKKSPDIYGINDEGLSEMTNVAARLNNFAYLQKSHGDSYEFTYVKANSGHTATVKSE